MINVDEGMGYTGRVRALVFEGDISTGDIERALARPLDFPLVYEFTDHNLVTNLGRERMTKLIVAETTKAASHIALSTTAITPAMTDTVATIVDRIATQALTIAQSYLTYYQRYVAYYTTTSFGSTGVAAAALLDAASTAATTNLFADATISVSKTTPQSLIAEWQVQATT